MPKFCSPFTNISVKLELTKESEGGRCFLVLGAFVCSFNCMKSVNFANVGLQHVLRYFSCLLVAPPDYHLVAIHIKAVFP